VPDFGTLVAPSNRIQNRDPHLPIRSPKPNPIGDTDLPRNFDCIKLHLAQPEETAREHQSANLLQQLHPGVFRVQCGRNDVPGFQPNQVRTGRRGAKFIEIEFASYRIEAKYVPLFSTSIGHPYLKQPKRDIEFRDGSNMTVKPIGRFQRTSKVTDCIFAGDMGPKTENGGHFQGLGAVAATIAALGFALIFAVPDHSIPSKRPGKGVGSIANESIDAVRNCHRGPRSQLSAPLRLHYAVGSDAWGLVRFPNRFSAHVSLLGALPV